MVTRRRGKHLSQLYTQIDKHADTILNGTVLAIDPSCGSQRSMPGWALFGAGKLQASGIIKINHRLPIEQRLRLIKDWCGETADVSVLCLERLQGSMVPRQLHWAVGVFMASLPGVLIEMPIQVWKKHVRTVSDYCKGDEADAVAIGEALITLAASRKK